MLFGELPPDLQDKAYGYHIGYRGELLAESREKLSQETLNAMFVFAHTKEGHQFWWDLYIKPSSSSPVAFCDLPSNTVTIPLPFNTPISLSTILYLTTSPPTPISKVTVSRNSDDTISFQVTEEE